KKENDLILHYCKTLPQQTGGFFKAVVDAQQRTRTACNHTATHLMHQALRSILGDHVEQKGSMVHSGMFRFDFSHFAKVTPEELAAVEQFVNARIQEQLPLEESRNIPKSEAVKQGALALFGEKYGDTVRAIRFGQSIELCGGTHVSNTTQIWHFKITAETAVAAGVRRIEAITGDAAKTYFEDQSQVLSQIQSLLNKPQDTVKTIAQLQAENAQLKKEVTALGKLKAQVLKKELEGQIKTLGGVQFLAQQVDLDAQGIKTLAFDLGQNKDNLVVVLGAVANGKPIISCYISKALVAEREWDAGKIVRSLGQHIKGGGGGQPFFATAGGSDPQGITGAIKAAESTVFTT
ncbi:MAG: DHHA1 domain-containing protein, partial [Flavobacteriaceae bacterium]